VPLTVVLDTCVLYSATLRDLLLNVAETGLYLPRWTEAIHDEWTRNLKLRRPDLPVESIERTRLEIDKSVPDCLITGYFAPEAYLDNLAKAGLPLSAGRLSRYVSFI
jgi:hypothetical protein